MSYASKQAVVETILNALLNHAGHAVPVSESVIVFTPKPGMDVTIRVRNPPMSVVASYVFTPVDISHAQFITNEWNRSTEYGGAAYVNSNGSVVLRYVHPFPGLQEDQLSSVTLAIGSLICAFLHFNQFVKALDRRFTGQEDT